MRRIRTEILARIESAPRVYIMEAVKKKIKSGFDFAALSLRLINRLRIDHEEVYDDITRIRMWGRVGAGGGNGGSEGVIRLMGTTDVFTNISFNNTTAVNSALPNTWVSQGTTGRLQ